VYEYYIPIFQKCQQEVATFLTQIVETFGTVPEQNGTAAAAAMPFSLQRWSADLTG
jgi:hypothetical protein